MRRSGEEMVWPSLPPYAQGSWRGSRQTTQGKPRCDGRGGVWVLQSGAIINRRVEAIGVAEVAVATSESRKFRNS